jgi:hypothetical protein
METNSKQVENISFLPKADVDRDRLFFEYLKER